jgi:hypothetical protein
MVVSRSVSNCIYKIYIPEHVVFDFLEYAKNSINCSTKCTWRITQFFDMFSLNIFRKKIWLLMTTHEIERVLVDFENHFHFKPDNIVLINCTMLFDIHVKIDLDSLYDKLCTVDMKDIFKLQGQRVQPGHRQLEYICSHKYGFHVLPCQRVQPGHRQLEYRGSHKYGSHVPKCLCVQPGHRQLEYICSHKYGGHVRQCLCVQPAALLEHRGSHKYAGHVSRVQRFAARLPCMYQ